MLVRRKHALRRAKEEGDLTPDGARRHEALGRVMAALATEAEFIESCRDLTWWRGSDDSWHLEWRDGPFASEVAVLLAERLAVPGDVTPAGPGSEMSAGLDVMGVRLELHAIDPMGTARVRAKPGFWRLAEALDTTRRTNARHPWEELLGG
ncbi:hypothetical protein MTP10_41570 [Nonomuraea sp. 3-1Str]|uniref:hypothetical protein n=1 Tax=Nonomuraea sp. 3-1Str TaxID=2929801 RepID=UPI00285C78FB|nr:hypothetical protein [Nonomuraea sp. 3-1Str]MDR8415210.1 hypothetical protein [Nonomuraea sp. 3-1Str]